MFSSIKIKILASHIGFLALLFVLLGGASYALLLSTVTSLQQKRMQEAATAQGRNLHNLIENKKLLLERIASSDPVGEFSHTFREGLLEPYLLQYSSDFAALSFVSDTGQELIKIVDGAISQNYQDLQDSVIFQEALWRPNRVVVRFCATTAPPGTPCFLQFAYGREDFGDFGGIIVGKVALADLLQQLGGLHHGQNGFMVLADRTGTILLAPDTTLIGRSLLTEGHIAPQLATRLARDLPLSQAGTFFGRESYLVSAAMPDGNDGQRMLAILPLDEFMAAPRTLRLIFTVGILAILTIALLIAMGLARGITTPIQHLTTSAQQIAREEWPQAIALDSRDEVGMLTASFNRMASKLQQALRDRDQEIDNHKKTAAALQAAKEEAEAMNTLKSEFLANVSHELRTPLNGILGMAELIGAQPLTDDQRNYLQMMRSSAQRLLQLINQLLDFAKIEAGRLTIDSVLFSIRATLDQHLEPLKLQAEQKGLRLDWTVTDAVATNYLGDPTRLGQVIVNLVANAIKFTQQGQITVTVDLETDAKEPRLHFTVTDTGIGIAKEKQGVIFDAFIQADGSTTRKYGGTGLGLAICARLVAEMKGRIWLESTPGHGSTFHVVLALQPAIAPYSNGPEESDQQPTGGDSTADQATLLHGLHILLAEDELVNRTLATTILQNHGAQVSTAEDGRTVLKMLAAGEPPDLILMDIQMPEMDGLQATAAIRRQEEQTGAHLPIVAMSAHARQQDQEQALAVGMDDYITKPITLKNMLETIAKHCDIRHNRPT